MPMVSVHTVTESRRLYSGPVNPGVPPRKETVTDPVLHEQITAAIDLVFAAADPRKISRVPGCGESVMLEVPASPGTKPAYGWELYRADIPGWPAPFRRIDYRRTSDGVQATMIAEEDGCTVTFRDALGHGTMDDFTEGVSALAGLDARATG